MGRGAKVRTAVLAATLSELTATGYADLTVENIALRSGVHKTTVYRRWKDREALVTDAVADLAEITLPFDDTGDLDNDLRTFARRLVDWLAVPTGRAVLALLVSDAGRLPAVAESKRRFFAGRIAAMEPRIRAAVRWGQLPARHRPGCTAQDGDRSHLPPAAGHRATRWTRTSPTALSASHWSQPAPASSVTNDQILSRGREVSVGSRRGRRR